MERYVVFERLSRGLIPSLAAGHYALIGTSDGHHGIARPNADTVWIDRESGRVHRLAQPDDDLPAVLGYGLRLDDIDSPRGVVFKIGVPGLFARAVALALPGEPVATVGDDGMRFDALSRRDVIGLLTESLALIGRVNARRDLDSLVDDPRAGIDAVILDIRLAAT